VKLGLVVGYSGKHVSVDMDHVLEAERLGFDSVWTAEAYGGDAVTTAAWVLARTSRTQVGTAITQIQARTPARAAGTGDQPEPSVGRPLPSRACSIRTSGCRGLARRSVRAPALADSGVRLSHPPDSLDRLALVPVSAYSISRP